MGDTEAAYNVRALLDALLVIGFAFAWGAYLVCVIGPFSLETSDPLSPQSPLVSAVCQGGVVVAMFAMWRCADRLERRRGERAIVASLCALAAAVLFLAGGVGIHASNVCIGLSLGATSHAWVCALSRGASHVPLLVVLSITIGAALYILTGVVIPGYAFYFAIVYLLASLGVLALCRSQLPERAYRSSADSRKVFPLTLRTAAVIFLYGVILGFVAQCVLEFAPSAADASLLLALGLLSGCLLYGLLFLRYRGYVPFGIAERIVLPVVIAALIFPMMFSDGFTRAAFFVVAFAVLVFFSSNSLAVQITMVQRFGLSANYHLSRGRIPVYAGMLVGWCFAVACGLWLEAFVPGGEQAFLPVLCAFVIVLNVVVACIPFEMPDRLAETEQEREHSEASNDADLPAPFEAACEAVACRCGLSPRELDVLLLLGRGRGVSSIAEKLVISQSTAKTHISHIYQKIGVNSREQLLDVLDANREDQSEG